MSYLDELFPPPEHYRRGRVARIKRSDDAFKSRLKRLSSYEKARSVARRDPEVMVKFGRADIKNYKHLKQALNYISRNGELELKDQDGNVLQSKEEGLATLEHWKDKQSIPEENGRFSHARRIILSMPVGTDQDKFKKACEHWAKDTLEAYDYLVAYHFEGEDPKSNHPHCHILVRSVGHNGKRLHISNSDRDQMREHFAKCLNKEGIRATATRRWSRAQAEKGISQEEYHIQKRRYKSDKKRAQAHAIARKKKQLEAQKKERLKHTLTLVNGSIKELVSTGYQDDMKVASGLSAHYRKQMEVNRSQMKEAREKATGLKDR